MHDAHIVNANMKISSTWLLANHNQSKTSGLPASPPCKTGWSRSTKIPPRRPKIMDLRPTRRWNIPSPFPPRQSTYLKTPTQPRMVHPYHRPYSSIPCHTTTNTLLQPFKKNNRRFLGIPVHTTALAPSIWTMAPLKPSLTHQWTIDDNHGIDNLDYSITVEYHIGPIGLPTHFNGYFTTPLATLLAKETTSKKKWFKLIRRAREVLRDLTIRDAFNINVILQNWMHLPTTK